MGNLHIKNSKYEVSVDLEDGNSRLVLKVRDRKNLGSNTYLHHKRYKYFELPSKIRKVYKNMSDFYDYLMANQDKIQLSDKSVIVQIEGQKVQIPFENKRQQSILFCQRQNQEIIHQEKNQDDVFLQNATINIIIGSGKNNDDKQTKPGNFDVIIGKNKENLDDSKKSLQNLIKRIRERNNKQHKEVKEELDVPYLIEFLQNQFNQWQANEFHIPNMNKKKTSEFNKEIQNFKKQLQQKKTQVQSLTQEIKKEKSKISILKGQNDLKNKKNQQLIAHSIKKDNQIQTFKINMQGKASLIQNLKQNMLKGNEQIQALKMELSANNKLIQNLTRKEQNKETDIIQQKESLKKELSNIKINLDQKTKETIELKIKIQTYKQICSPEKILKIRSQTQEQTMKKVIQQFLKDISFHFTSSKNKNNAVTVKIVNKESLLRHIDNILSQMQALKSQKCGQFELLNKIKQLQDRNNYLEKALKKKKNQMSSIFQDLSDKIEIPSLNSSEIQKIKQIDF